MLHINYTPKPIVGAMINELTPSDMHRGFESWAGHTNSYKLVFAASRLSTHLKGESGERCRGIIIMCPDDLSSHKLLV